VFHDPTLSGVDEEHRSRAKPSPALDALRSELQHACLAADDDQSVCGLRPATGSKTVAVEGRTDERSVGEDERRGSVPWLHLVRMELVEGTEVGIEVVLSLPRRRHHHHDGVRQRAPGESEQLEHLVEGCGITRTVRADRQQRADVAQELRLELRLTRTHPVAVASDSVDLAVVGEHAQGLGERPGGEGVGRITRVHDRKLRGEALVLEVRIERLQLERGHHALVPEGARGECHEVGAELVPRALPQSVGKAIERDAGDAGSVIARARDEELLEGRS
ncbi:hypothetical protein ABE10_00105, partial [Bacillus toyonensis]|nr:hypothetical protein [Bacillus toyonensis]